MARYTLFVIVALFAVVALQQVDALKCWRCSSDTSPAAFCGDPFDPSLLSELQRRRSYVDCSFPSSNYNTYGGDRQRQMCKKSVHTVNNRVIVNRSCAWEDSSQPLNSTCSQLNTSPHIRTEACETCYDDGCNSAGQYGPAAILTVVCAALAKLFAF